MLSIYSAAGGQWSHDSTALVPQSLIQFPIAIMSLSYVDDLDDFIGRPVGLLVMASCHNASILIKVMSGWVTNFAPQEVSRGVLEAAHLCITKRSPLP